MRLTMRPEAKKRRPNGTTTAAAAIAMATAKHTGSPVFESNKQIQKIIIIIITEKYTARVREI